MGMETYEVIEDMKLSCSVWFICLCCGCLLCLCATSWLFDVGICLVKMQLSLYKILKRVMYMYGIMEKQVHTLLTSTPDGGEWLVSGPVCFTPREKAPVPRMDLDTVESVAPIEFINVEWWSLL